MTAASKTSRDIRWLTVAPTVFGGAAAGIGVLALAGWMFDNPVLMGFHPNLVSMKPNTALSIVFLAVSVVLLNLGQKRRAVRTLAGMLSLLASVLGVLSLIEFLLVIDFGIDQLLFREHPDAIETWSPGRMAFITSVCFLMAGLALHIIAREYTRIKHLPDLLFSATALVTVFVLLGYLFDESGMRALGMFGSMALNTAIALLLICVGSFALQPDRRTTLPVFTNSPASIMLRWLLPAAVGVPIVAGWLRWTGERHGLYGTGIGVALSVGTTIALLVILIRMGAGAIDRAQSKIDSLERSARENDQRLRALLDAAQISIYIFDRDGRFVYTNSKVDNLYQVSTGGLIGKTLFDLFPADRAGDYHTHNEQVWASGSAIEVEETAQIPSGARTYLSHKFPIRDESGSMVGLGGISYDITERKRMEGELRQRDEQIQTLYDDLLRQNLRLQSTNSELESFSYSVSHDLRAPLRAIDGFSLALMEDYGNKLDGTAKDYLKRVRGGAQRMAQLIDDLLRLSRVSRTELVVNEVDISSLAQRIVEQLRTNEPNRHVEVQIEDGLQVQGDQQLLTVLLENLLGNAWKFTSHTAQPVIRLGSMMQDSNRVLYVRDNGAGFDMTYVDKLFNAFQRLHTESEFAGTGIGLATVRRIIRRHGGDIWAEGAINEGATFFFTMESITCQGGTYAPQGHTVGRG